ncbi:Tubulin-specific chaperone D [Toxocara canis]|uniref:Tubulin-specific chaperone D n=1 Tax=Toxocara canis TaxID=6265 RepID=A0A0B2VX84_TOXCA|nr:Tubulin-specific chaperone D [Toxocara canis]
MQEKVLLEAVEDVIDDDLCSEAAISTTPSLQAFADAHRKEIFSLICEIPSFASSPNLEEAKLERYRTVLNLYQEQPMLLDCCINDMITKLLSFVKLLEDGQTKFDNVSKVAMLFLSHLAKVRGYKHFLSLLPHEKFSRTYLITREPSWFCGHSQDAQSAPCYRPGVEERVHKLICRNRKCFSVGMDEGSDVCYMEKVLVSLEKYSGLKSSSTDYETRHVLLLWMTILCKNPFDFSRFDSCVVGPSTVQRIISAVMPSLYVRVNKCHPIAALLLAIVMTREDARAKLLISTVESSMNALSTCSTTSSTDTVLVGNLYLLTAIFKHGRRDDLFPLASRMLRVVSPLTNFIDADLVVKKLLIKLIQRLGMVFLKPKVSKWRYERGNRVLTLDAESVNKVKERAVVSMDGDEPINEEDYDIPCEELEIVLDVVLRALRDRDTDIRWSAAKGVGRVASRLPKQLANDVLSSILASNFDDMAGHAAWHGGCLAIAELSRRGYLLPERLPHITPVLLKALVFEERQGRHALGANVRDAACYICWALARAFRPSDMASYVDQIATSLVCVALFDREINVRRAASAAFQENVGRQGSFPNGIEILTLIDYFAVGTRRHAYLEVAVEVAKYSFYSRSLIDHLVDHKITHWDEDIRILAAESLRRLAAFETDVLLQQVESRLIPLVNSEQPVSRQGSILALAGALSGLDACGVFISESLYRSVARIPSDTFAMCEMKTHSLGGLLIRRAINTFIRLLSAVIPPHFIPLHEWLRSIDLIASDESEQLRKGAVLAASRFFLLFNNPERAALLVNRVKELYIHQVVCAQKEYVREGIASVLSVLPPDIYTFRTNDSVPLSADIINTLIAVVDGRSGIDASWAYGRRASADALTKIVLVVGFDSLSLADSARIIDCMVNALNDYTMDQRGDVGWVLRASAMRGLCTLLPKAQRCGRHSERVDEVVCKIVQQSCEKIDAIRICAAEVLCDWLRSGLENIVEKEVLEMVYVTEIASSGLRLYPWRSRRCFTRLASLLKSRHYRYHALIGFIVSAGGPGESTMHAASDALLSVLATYRDSSEEMEVFLRDLATIFSNNIGVTRITMPILRILEQIFVAETLTCFEANPDSSSSLSKIIDLVAAESTRKGKPHKVRIGVAILCQALHFNCESRIWRKAASVIVRTLRSPYPTLRRTAAEQLYECVMSEAIDLQDKKNGHRSELLSLLTKTEWQADGDFSEISRSIARILDVTA